MHPPLHPPGEPSPDPTVAILNWPRDEDRRRQLAAAGRPRLLLVEPGTPPPPFADHLEDWARVPVEPEELAARWATLLARAGESDADAIDASIDEDGIFRHGSSWVALPPLEQRLLGALLARPGAVVRRGELIDATWPDGAPTDERALDTRVKVLRRRIARTGARVHTVATRGYLVELPRTDPPAE